MTSKLQGKRQASSRSASAPRCWSRFPLIDCVAPTHPRTLSLSSCFHSAAGLWVPDTKRCDGHGGGAVLPTRTDEGTPFISFPNHSPPHPLEPAHLNCRYLASARTRTRAPPNLSLYSLGFPNNDGDAAQVSRSTKPVPMIFTSLSPSQRRAHRTAPRRHRRRRSCPRPCLRPCPCQAAATLGDGWWVGWCSVSRKPTRRKKRHTFHTPPPLPPSCLPACSQQVCACGEGGR